MSDFAIWFSLGLGLILVVIVIYALKAPYPFEHEGQKYRRFRGNRFEDSAKQPVTDPVLISKLRASYDRAKYGDESSKDWGNSSD